MFNEEINDIELAPDSVVRQAALDFAAALADTPYFAAFEVAAERLTKDTAAQKTIQAFQTKQQTLQMMQRLNAVKPEDQAELESLRLAFLSEPAITAYVKAQAELAAVCQAAADIISRYISLNYAAACGTSCCG